MTGCLVTVRVDAIELAPQPRTQFDEDAIRSLAESIERDGLQHPPTGFDLNGKTHITSGERRVRAHMLLGRDEIPVYLTDPPEDDVTRLTRQLVSNLQRKDLDPIDQSNGIRTLMERARVTADATAKLLGLSPSSVSRSLKLLTLPDSLQAHVASGAIPPDVGYRLARIEDSEEQARLADEVLGKRLTRDALARKRGRFRRAEETKRGSRVTAALGMGRTMTFVGNELTLDSMVECLEQLLAKARKARGQGLTLTTFASTLRDLAKADTKSGGRA